MATLGALRSQLRDVLQEPDEQGRFLNTTLNRYINDGLLDVADRVECLVASVSLPVVNSSLLPDDFLRVHRVAVNGRRVRPTTALYLDREARAQGVNWTEQFGDPTHFFLEGSTIRLYPKPTEIVDVYLTYVRVPSPLLQDEDKSPLPMWLNPLVVMYAASEAWKSDGDPRWSVQMQEYEAQVSLARRRWDMRQPEGRTTIRLGG